MSVVAFISAKQSPGITTASVGVALQLQKSAPTVVLELDPDGGDLAARCGLSHEGPGLLTLAAAGRRERSDFSLLDHAQFFGPSKLPVVTASSNPSRTRAAIETLTPNIKSMLQFANGNIVIDAGRFRNDGPTSDVLRSVDHIFFLCRPTLSGVDALIERQQDVDALGIPRSVVLVGDRPYGSADIERHIEMGISATIADDARAASMLFDEPGSIFYRKSSLARSFETFTFSALRDEVGARS